MNKILISRTDSIGDVMRRFTLIGLRYFTNLTVGLNLKSL
jgi:hypothetical protein